MATVSLAILLSGVDGVTGLPADAKDAAGQQRTVVGKCVALTGPALQREGKDGSWKPLKSDSPVYSGDLLVAPAQATILGKDGAVQLALIGRPPQDGSTAGQDSAVVLHNNLDVDLDVMLQRGRVSMTNGKDSGAAKVRLRFQDQTWDVSLADKGSTVGFQADGEWPRGVPFTREPKEGVAPTLDLVAIVLHGQADLKAPPHQFAMSAPPGPAYFHWNSIAGQERGLRRLTKVPKWAEDGDAANLKAALDQLRTQLANRPVPATLAQTLESADPAARRLAVYGLAAIDDLPRLIAVLADEKHADVRQAAAVALRDWISRGPGQDKRLYDELVTRGKYPAGQAEIVLQLLHTFGDRDLARPETYETLLAYLRHSKLPIRELSRWQIYSLVPAGKAIAYDAAGSTENRERAYKEWLKLIPEGSLPPAAKPGEK